MGGNTRKQSTWWLALVQGLLLSLGVYLAAAALIALLLVRAVLPEAGDVSGSLGGVRAGGPGGSRSLRRQEPLGTVSGSCSLHRSFSGGDRRCGALVLGRADPAGQGRDPAAVRSGRRSPGRRNRAAPTSKERGRSLPAAPAARKNRTVIFHKNAEQAQCRRSTDGPPGR